MNPDKMFRVQDAVFILQSLISTIYRKRATDRSYLASSINNLSCVLLSLELDNLAEGILNGGIITLDEMPIDELHGER